jgi:glutamate-1-semialdehyde 2,1-aminomutase
MANTVIDDLTARYLAAHPKSKTHFEEGRKYVPGGVTRITTFFAPYPMYMDHGAGAYLFDCDSNRYIDFLGNYTALVHGHAHPAITQAIAGQITKGTIFGAASPIQYELAKRIESRVPGVELLNFTSSGTEATMMAMRFARAVTGKNIILKMDGGYHGSNDYGLVNLNGAAKATLPGIPPGVIDSMMVVPFNDLEALEDTIEKHKDEIAAVMLEPLLGNGGGVLPRPGYLQALREITLRHDILLIFDEIVTLRLHIGGYQAMCGVIPDITTMGKIIGGGMGIGAFGGKRSLMDRFDPSNPKLLYHTGTFYAQEISMAAGIASLQSLDSAAIDRINILGGKMRDGFNSAFAKHGIKGQTLGIGSLAMVHWTNGAINAVSDAQNALKAAGALPRLLHLEMINRGIYSAPRGLFCTSTPMTDADVEFAIRAFDETLQTLKPYIAENTPHLL